MQHSKKKLLHFFELKYCVFIFFCNFTSAQTLGGLTSFSFVTQPNTAALSSLGGINISTINHNVAMAFHNPALLRNSHKSQVEVSFNNFFAGIKNISATGAFTNKKDNINFAAGINFINYGLIDETDAAGNIIGKFRATDYLLQLQASTQVNENFFVGTSIKFINSQYAQFTSNAIAIDVGLNYCDQANNIQAALVIKNIGATLKPFTANTLKGELPFDIQLGITKKLAKAPFQLSITAHHLQALNPLYNDTIFNAQLGNSTKNNTILQKIFSHLIIANEILLSDRVQATVSYNFLRQNSLNTFNVSNGLSGFNFGLSCNLKKLHIAYATGLYQQNMYHHFSFQFNLKDKGL